jgi:GH24 family phage-related lysozyme (muramidase)
LVNSILQNDIESRERKLSKLLGKAEVQVTQCQFDALFSFMFNIGEGAFEKSQLYINLKKNLQEKNYKIISEQFLSWNKPNLKTRRLSEISEFFSEEKNKIGFPLVLLGILTVLYISI